MISLSKSLAKNDKDFHIFVISSTVLPGSIEENFIPLIEKYSNRFLNKGFGIVYDPDFVALGEVIKGFLNPELVLIGESNSFSGDVVCKIHNSLCENKPYIARMSIVSAEIAKISLNTYITVKISFANTLANICEKVKDADLDAITKSIGVDKRISPYYFKGALAFGGNCFPRDTKAFIKFASRYGNDAEIIRAVESVNSYQNKHLAELVLDKISDCEDKNIGILGLSFRPDTPVITGSPAIALIETLLENGLRVLAYDKLAIRDTKALFGEQIEYVSSAKECVDLSSLCVITYPSNEFKEAVESTTKNIIVIDCWRIIDKNRLSSNVNYKALGYFS